MNKCVYITKTGTTCRLNKQNGTDFCNKHKHHNPDSIKPIKPFNIDSNICNKICISCSVEKSETFYQKNNNKCKSCERLENKCSICDKSFSSKKNLDRHYNLIHLNIRNIKCPTCDYTTDQKSNLKHHICKNKEDGEKVIQRKLEKHFNAGSRVTPVGIIDILTEDKMIEIKAWSGWKTALGQMLAYGRFYPEHEKIVYFYGSKIPDSTLEVLKDTYEIYNISIMTKESVELIDN